MSKAHIPPVVAIGIVYVLPLLAHLVFTHEYGQPPPLHSDRINAHQHTSIILTHTLILSMRMSLPCSLILTSPLLHHTIQSLFFPRCSSDEGCLRWRKARTHLSIPGFACETPHLAGDSQTTRVGKKYRYAGIPRYFFGVVRTATDLPVPRYSGISISSNKKI